MKLNTGIANRLTLPSGVTILSQAWVPKFFHGYKSFSEEFGHGPVGPPVPESVSSTES